jgi:hypothetical protein
MATASRDVAAELAFLTRALKAPTLREAAGRLAERARAESWTHEEYLAACLQREGLSEFLCEHVTSCCW